MNERHYAVDRIEGTTAVLKDDDGRPIAVPLARLPERIRQGSVIRVVHDRTGKPDWAGAVIDHEEAERRVAEARAMLQDEPGS